MLHVVALSMEKFSVFGFVCGAGDGNCIPCMWRYLPQTQNYVVFMLIVIYHIDR